MTPEPTQQTYYARYYNRVGADRNDLRTNSGALYQTLASEASFVGAFSQIDLEPSSTKVLDVGCGSGGSFFQLIRLGYKIENVTGIEIQSDRLEEGRRNHPRATMVHGDATNMDFQENSFDIVMESTVFATLVEDAARQKISSEIIRVCRPGGYLVLLDWRTPSPGKSDYKALTMSELKTLFQIGTRTSLVGVFKGALVPPIGRLLSSKLPSVYFLVGALCPVLVGQVAYLLRKLPADVQPS